MVAFMIRASILKYLSCLILHCDVDVDHAHVADVYVCMYVLLLYTICVRDLSST